MAQFIVVGTQATAFTVPTNGSPAALTRGTTKHRYQVTMAEGDWTYRIIVASAVGSRNGKLRFRIKRNGVKIVDRVKIAPGQELTGTISNGSATTPYEILFTRGIGSRGVTYLLTFDDPAPYTPPPTPDNPPRLWFWGGKGGAAGGSAPRFWFWRKKND